MIARLSTSTLCFPFALLLALAACNSEPTSNTSSTGSASEAGCVKDTDCKGDRICVDGQCRAPTQPGASASAAAAAASTPSEAGSADALGAEDMVPCGPQLDTGCATDLHVQLLSIGRDVPDTYDFPEVQALLRGKPDYHGVRVVEASNDGRRRIAAIVRNRCQAERLTNEANRVLKTGAGTLCMKLEVTRTILVVR